MERLLILANDDQGEGILIDDDQTPCLTNISA